MILITYWLHRFDKEKTGQRTYGYTVEAWPWTNLYVYINIYIHKDKIFTFSLYTCNHIGWQVLMWVVCMLYRDKTPAVFIWTQPHWWGSLIKPILENWLFFIEMNWSTCWPLVNILVYFVLWCYSFRMQLYPWKFSLDRCTRCN